MASCEDPRATPTYASVFEERDALAPPRRQGSETAMRFADLGPGTTHIPISSFIAVLEARHGEPSSPGLDSDSSRPVASPFGSGAPRSAIRLGALEVRPGARMILLDGAVVELGGRAFDILWALLSAQGEVVSKDELLRRVWPSVTVVESNLKVQLCQLRRALGRESWRIRTISGRGYLMVADDARPVDPATAATDRRLVIVVDADRGTQEMVVCALVDVARYLDGASRLGLIAPGERASSVAC